MGSVKCGTIVRGPSHASLMRWLINRPGEKELIYFNIQPDQVDFPELGIKIEIVSLARKDFYSEGTVFFITGEVLDTFGLLKRENTRQLEDRHVEWIDDWSLAGKYVAFRYRLENRKGIAVIPGHEIVPEAIKAMMGNDPDWKEEMLSHEPPVQEKRCPNHGRALLYAEAFNTQICPECHPDLSL